jgi:DNA-binding response OmpR family regulator
LADKETARPIRVLLADDEEPILESYAAYLEFSGYEVIKAIDGEDALEKIRKEKPDIIFLDLRMPKIDGWEACRRIKNDPKICGIPVIFLTALDQTRDHERARALCVQGYLTKPCEPAELVHQIQACIKRVAVTEQPKGDA